MSVRPLGGLSQTLARTTGCRWHCWQPPASCGLLGPRPPRLQGAEQTPSQVPTSQWRSAASDGAWKQPQEKPERNKTTLPGSPLHSAGAAGLESTILYRPHHSASKNKEGRRLGLSLRRSCGLLCRKTVQISSD